MERNLRSEATYLNEDRYGAVQTPEDLDADGTEVVAHGTLVWVEPTSPVPWLGLIVVAAALTFLASRGRLITTAVALAGVAIGAAIVTVRSDALAVRPAPAEA